MTAPVLNIEQLSVLRGGRKVLTDVDLRVEPGEVVALLGPNGAGKSSLLAAIAGQLRPESGQVGVEGRVATAMQAGALASRTARANVELALRWWGVRRRDRRQRALAALDQVGATDLADRQVSRLSGGERRRVHLARALAVRPDLLLLDEPFAAIDSGSRDQLLDVASTVIRSSAGAVLVVVHDRGEAWALADRVIVLLDGMIAADAPPQQLLDQPPSPEVARFLGYTGEVQIGADSLFTRPQQVRLDRLGAFRGVVIRRLLLEDGWRLTIDLPDGQVQTIAQDAPPEIGDDVRVQIVGGVRFTDPG